ncbi:unnamed protein product, partial [marine sediment metagenome]
GMKILRKKEVVNRKTPYVPIAKQGALRRYLVN